MWIPLEQPPAQDDEQRLTWTVGDWSLRAERCAGGWRLTRPGGDLLLTEALVARLGLAVRLGAGDVVARLDPPVWLAPQSETRLWLRWTLELGLVCEGEGEPVVLASERSGLRRTVLGPVTSGQVLPALSAPVLAGEGAPVLAGEARLAVSVENRAATPALLRRVPVFEPALSVYRDGAGLSASEVLVVITGEQLAAEAHTQGGEGPAGAALLRRGETAASNGILRWWMDATRRSVEYQL